MKKLILVTFLFLVSCTNANVNISTPTNTEIQESYTQAFLEYYNEATQFKPVETTFTGFGATNVFFSNTTVNGTRASEATVQYYKLMTSIEDKAKAKNIIVDVMPVVGLSAKEVMRAKNKTNALKEQFIILYKDQFNPLYTGDYYGHLPLYDSFARALSRGFAMRETGYFVGDVAEDFYYTVYIVGTVIETKPRYLTSLEERTRVKLYYQKTPFISSNKNLKIAEIATKNLDFETADKHYLLAQKEVTNSAELKKFEKLSQKFKNLPTTWKNWRADYDRTMAELKKKSNSSNVSFSSILLEGLATFSEEMEKTSQTLAYQNMAITNAVSGAYTSKTVGALTESNNALVNSSNMGQQRISDDVFKRRYNALERRKDADIELATLYTIKGDLIALYNHKEGYSLRSRIDKEIQRAQTEKTNAYNALNTLINKEEDLFREYLKQNPNKVGIVTTNIEQSKKVRHLQKMRESYGTYYKKQKKLGLI